MLRASGWTNQFSTCLVITTRERRDPECARQRRPGTAWGTRAQLADIEILPSGDALHWASLDFTISAPGLVASLFWPSARMSELGRDVLEVVAGTNVVGPAEELVDRIGLDMHVDRVRLQA